MTCPDSVSYLIRSRRQAVAGGRGPVMSECCRPLLSCRRPTARVVQRLERVRRPTPCRSDWLGRRGPSASLVGECAEHCLEICIRGMVVASPNGVESRVWQCVGCDEHAVFVVENVCVFQGREESVLTVNACTLVFVICDFGKRFVICYCSDLICKITRCDPGRGAVGDERSTSRRDSSASNLKSFSWEGVVRPPTSALLITYWSGPFGQKNCSKSIWSKWCFTTIHVKFSRIYVTFCE